VTFAENIIAFNKQLTINQPLPQGVEVMNPYQDKTTFTLSSTFYKKYYRDHNRRVLIMGINPGRFGGGITGVPFTDPIKLAYNCNIPNDLQKKAELSADFIYQMIEAYGGLEAFYRDFYISAVSPLGFTKDGKNMNYYDSKELTSCLHDFILDCIQKQLTFGIHRHVCYCLGEGENYKFLKKLNNTHRFFDEIVPLPHPRFIMQYRRKKIEAYIDLYLQKFNRD